MFSNLAYKANINELWVRIDILSLQIKGLAAMQRIYHGIYK
jgi:hypothetical protein